MVQILNYYNYGASDAPSRKHTTDAGMDVRFTPKSNTSITVNSNANINELNMTKDNKLVIPAHVTVKLPLGFGIAIPEGYVGYIEPRSSVSSQGLIPSHAPVDCGYTGEIHAIMTNTTDADLTIEADERVAQLVIQPILTNFETVEVDPTTVKTERGSNGFGSTGTK